MRYVIVVIDTKEETYHEPVVYGPYDNKVDAFDRASVFPGSMTLDVEVVPMRSLSEQLDNPWGDYNIGDSPDE